MKTHKSKWLMLSLTIVGSCTSFLVSSQTIIRSSINCTGGSYSSETAMVQSTTGQSYATNSSSHGNVSVQPGFIQSNSFYILGDEALNELMVEVYPNPATYAVQIESKERLTDVEITVHSMSGGKLLELSSPVFTSQSIDCSDWPNGTYVIMLSSGLRSTQTKLIINN